MVGGDAGARAVRLHADDFLILDTLIVAGMGGQPVSESYFLIQWAGLRPLGYEVLFELLVEL
jgi:hypothetical protein